MHKITLDQEDLAEIGVLLEDLTARHDSVEDPGFLNHLSVYAQELPRRVRVHLNDFKLLEPTSALCVISGYRVDDESIGETPKHWKEKRTPSPTLAEEMLLLLFGNLLGEAIGWATQQDGYIVHDLCPIPGHEGEQLGTGSEQVLWWHTEDAFHPFRGDYVGMLCLRNPDRVATTFANLEGIELSPEHRDLLFQDLFTIRPDESHLPKNRSETREVDELLSSSYRQIEQMSTRPEKIALLQGDRQAPYLRIDSYFMDPLEDRQAQEAVDHLVRAIDSKLEEVVLSPGDFCFIDNFQAVHGRRAFKARYDGKDRWMKRINVTRDLRRSRASRASASSRTLF